MTDNPFKERLNIVTRRNRNGLAKHRVDNRQWPFEKKVEAVTQYLVLGNMRQVSVLTGVPYDTLCNWKNAPYWREIEQEIRASQNIEMDVRLSKIVEKSLDAVLDRVENGDFIYDQKTGEMRRKPAALRDIHRVSIDTLGKRELLRGNATERKETSQISIQEQLKMLALEMAKWNNPNKAVVIENEVEDAVYDERETGLQEGEPEVQLPAGDSSPEGGAERSPEASGESGPSNEG